MAGRKKTETVEAEVVETAVVPAGEMWKYTFSHRTD